MTDLLLIRHGEPEMAGNCMGRKTDTPLSGRGLIQADHVADSLQEEVPSIIYSSPLSRAIQTVKPLANRLNLTPIISHKLAEIDFGEWEDCTWSNIQKRYPDTWSRWLDNPGSIAPPGGETLEVFNHRIMQCVEEILQQHDSQKVLISTHAGPIRAVLGYALDIEFSVSRTASVDYASLSRFRCYCRDDSLSLVHWNIPLHNDYEWSPKTVQGTSKKQL